MVELNHSSLRSFDFLQDIFIPLCFGNHIVLNSFFVVHVTLCNLLKLLLLDHHLAGDGSITALLVGCFVDIEAFTFLLEVSQVGIQSYELLLVVLLLDDF
jgi:hypothetical protein